MTSKLARSYFKIHVHRAAIDKYPDRFALLQSTFKKVFDDPAFPEVVKKSKGNWEYINYGGVEECATYVKQIFEIGARYKALLSGKA